VEDQQACWVSDSTRTQGCKLPNRYPNDPTSSRGLLVSPLLVHQTLNLENKQEQWKNLEGHHNCMAVFG
jgi:hypothetical protein